MRNKFGTAKHSCSEKQFLITKFVISNKNFPYFVQYEVKLTSVEILLNSSNNYNYLMNKQIFDVVHAFSS